MHHQFTRANEHPDDVPAYTERALAHAAFLGMHVNDLLSKGVAAGSMDVDRDYAQFDMAIRGAWAARVAELQATSTPSIERTFSQAIAPATHDRMRRVGAYEADRIAFYDHCFLRTLGHMIELRQLRSETVALLYGGREIVLHRRPFPSDESVLPRGRIAAVRVLDPASAAPLVHVDGDTWVRAPEETELIRTLDTVFALFE